MTKFGILKYFILLSGFSGGAFILWLKSSGKKITFHHQTIVGLSVFSLFILFYIYAIEPNWITVHRLTVHNAELARVLEGYKIVQITDIHLRHGLGFREKSLLKKVNALNPDLLLITGDIADGKSQIPAAIELFRGMKAKFGKWGVPGNTDLIFMSADYLKQSLLSADVHILVDESEWVQLDNGFGFWLVGVNDPVTGHAHLKKALENVREEDAKILMAHGPQIFKDAQAYGIPLTLVGHTHGGQVGIAPLIQLSKYANRGMIMSGLHRNDGSQIYVNRGIGTKTLPIRFLCRPEITVVSIKP